MSHFTKSAKNATPLIPLTKDQLAKWQKKQSQRVQAWLSSTGFKAGPGETCLLSDNNGKLNQVLVGVSKAADLWDCGNLSKSLPAGNYCFDQSKAADIEKWALGWALGAYSFGRYKNDQKQPKKARLLLPKTCDSRSLENTVEAFYLARDLINTPAGDMAPAQLASAARALAKKHKATCKVIVGKDLLAKNYPAIHAVGRAVETKDQAPRLIDFSWGKKAAPKVTLVGKGVCFDTGGLDLKSAGGMKLMKKDMGGAANVLGLAHMIMAAKLPIRLRVLIPAVENSVSGNALRPLDVVPSRNGKTIEIGNTDAEGRVILADALSEAAREKPELIVDFATLTGAARVALGAEVPALFSNDDKFAANVIKAGMAIQDPLWQLPLWPGYRKAVTGKTADLTNAPEGGFGGAITAALFLQEFVEPATKWAHIDLMAWNQGSKPGRPEGGEAMGIRAFFNTLKEIYTS
ncbi:MAG: leucyl aminopeptidase family protein [Rhodospirillaceae bacterium]|jgi:leucyl aminopeptidase|nr:leucyl aminopeptidase family protein [Rhodospirillaceae bacterium]MBT7954862.1 leucyl aminopeptidase family protein [Rhodospirillaceae bacterium]